MGANSFKRWSPTFTKNIILGIAFIILVTGMALYITTAGLRCVDSNGCLREHCLCHWDRFSPVYQNLIRESMSNNPSCRLSIGDPSLSC